MHEDYTRSENYVLKILCTGCAKKKKDILNIYVKSQIINFFFKLGC